jgi:acyl-CoA oxidase
VTVEQVALAVAHCQAVLLDTFTSTLDKLEEGGGLTAASPTTSTSDMGFPTSSSSGQQQAAAPLSRPTMAVLRRLCLLFGLTLLEGGAGDLLEAGYMSGEQAGGVRQRQRELLAELRPDAVALVDAFGFEDYALNSCLGREDGDVYTALLAAAQGSPLNDTAEGPAWEPVLKAAMHRKPIPKL